MIDHMGNSFFGFQKKGLFLILSQKTEKVFGENIEGKSVLKTLFKDLSKEEKETLKEAYEGFSELEKDSWDIWSQKIPHQIRYFNELEKAYKSLNLHCFPVWDSKGKLQRVIHTIDDRTEYDFLINKKNIYSIKIASQLTGVPENTIRSWERRYNALKPFRNDKGKRFYSDEDIERLNLLKKGVDKGVGISTIASLEIEELRRLDVQDKGQKAVIELNNKDIEFDEEESLSKIKMSLMSENYRIFIHELNKLSSFGTSSRLPLKFFPLFLNFLKKTL